MKAHAYFIVMTISSKSGRKSNCSIGGTGGTVAFALIPVVTNTRYITKYISIEKEISL